MKYDVEYGSGKEWENVYDIRVYVCKWAVVITEYGINMSLSIGSRLIFVDTLMYLDMMEKIKPTELWSKSFLSGKVFKPRMLLSQPNSFLQSIGFFQPAFLLDCSIIDGYLVRKDPQKIPKSGAFYFHERPHISDQNSILMSWTRGMQILLCKSCNLFVLSFFYASLSVVSSVHTENALYFSISLTENHRQLIYFQLYIILTN